jgi:hypothetical protein
MGKHGERAEIHRIADLAIAGDRSGAAVWRQILEAVRRLCRK